MTATRTRTRNRSGTIPDRSRLDEVNAVLAIVMHDSPEGRARLVTRLDSNRIMLRITGRLKDGTERWRDVDASIRSDGLWLANSGKPRPFCGTEEQAIVQLIRWARGLPRRPRDWWWYVTGPGVRLGGFPLLEAVVKSSYFADEAAVSCVRCGKRDPRDWWSLDGLTGPACRHVTSDGCPPR